MKMTKLLYTSLLFSVPLMIMFSGCSKKFIELVPLDQANEKTAFNTPSDMNQAVLGIYTSFQNNSSYAIDKAVMTEVVTDNAYAQPTRLADANRTGLREFELFSMSPNNSYCKSRWTGSYAAIARANLVLDKMGGISFPTDAIKQQYIAEAKFLRALFYFDLVQFFGGVPLSLNSIKNSSDAFQLKKAEQSEVYQAISKDLTDAAANLPVSYPSSDVGRATRGAAKALLAKVYLTSSKADAAIPLLRELMAAPYSYRLMATYPAVFNTDNTIESIFEVQYSSAFPGKGNALPNFFLSNDANSGTTIFGSPFLGEVGSGICIGTKELYASFEPGDTRRNHTMQKFFSAQEADSLNIVRKYRSAPSAPNNSENNLPVLRYADVLLMLAEALNEANKAPAGEAYGLVDQIRVRAGLPVLTRNLDYQKFRTMLLQERRSEFAFEHHRWFDLKRFNAAVSVLSAKGHPIQAFHLLFPIPRIEVDISSGNIPQNPGYN